MERKDDVKKTTIEDEASVNLASVQILEFRLTSTRWQLSCQLVVLNVHVLLVFSTSSFNTDFEARKNTCITMGFGFASV